MEALAAIAFVLALAAAAINWIARKEKEASGRQKGVADPCDTCLRWSECNGVDAEFCEVREGLRK